eukprot:7383318-Prymnesium_polylepis.2
MPRRQSVCVFTRPPSCHRLAFLATVAIVALYFVENIISSWSDVLDAIWHKFYRQDDDLSEADEESAAQHEDEETSSEGSDEPSANQAL